MPELPEVETTCRGIAPHVLGKRITEVIVREPRLRQRVPPTFARDVRGRVISAVERRAKYLLLRTDAGTLIIHLGMSGSLRVVPAHQPAGAHDHVDWCFENGLCLRLRDPRRFGLAVWTRGDPASHSLLRDLGPEPLVDLDADALFQRAQGRKAPVKQFIMDSRNMVGVGNIYASEALFRAGIHPARAAGRISRKRYHRLVAAIREVLGAAINAGGTTLRDFVGSEGKPGYFSVHLQVYGRAGEPCHACGTEICLLSLGQRSTYYCPHCQR